MVGRCAGGNKCCLDWLWNAGVAYQEYRGEANALQRQPDYCAPSYESEYLPRLRRFLTAYRDRYHQPGGPVIRDQVMGFGDWGEWHVMWSHYKWPSREKKRAVLSRIIETYADIFAPDATNAPQLSIAQVYDDNCGGDTPLKDAVWRQALDVAQKRGFSFSRHGFIDGLGGWPNDFMDTYWQTNPMLAEANWSYDQIKDDQTHGTMREHVDAYANWHSIWAHQYLHAASYRRAMQLDRAELERALQPGGIGYRFVPLSLSWTAACVAGDSLTLEQSWVNRNASWCVHPFRLMLFLLAPDGREVFSAIDTAFDPRPWVRDRTYDVVSKFPLSETLQPGKYRVALALVDSPGRPRVRLGIQGADAELRYAVGEIVIKPKPAP